MKKVETVEKVMADGNIARPGMIVVALDADGWERLVQGNIVMVKRTANSNRSLREGKAILVELEKGWTSSDIGNKKYWHVDCSILRKATPEEKKIYWSKK